MGSVSSSSWIRPARWLMAVGEKKLLRYCESSRLKHKCRNLVITCSCLGVNRRIRLHIRDKNKNKVSQWDVLSQRDLKLMQQSC